MTQTDILHPNNFKFPPRSRTRIKRKTISDLLQGWVGAGARVGQHMRKVVRAERDAGGVRRTVHQHRSLARRASLARSPPRHKPPSQKEQTNVTRRAASGGCCTTAGRERERVAGAASGSALPAEATQECGSASTHNVFRTHKASSSFFSSQYTVLREREGLSLAGGVLSPVFATRVPPSARGAAHPETHPPRSANKS